MDELIQNLPNVGFPIVLSLFLLVRMEKKMDELSNSIRELSEALRK